MKPSKITVKAICDQRTTASGEGHQANVHLKTSLTVILHRFDSGPVGRIARSGLTLQVQQEVAGNHADSSLRHRSSHARRRLTVKLTYVMVDVITAVSTVRASVVAVGIGLLTGWHAIQA